MATPHKFLNSLVIFGRIKNIMPNPRTMVPEKTTRRINHSAFYLASKFIILLKLTSKILRFVQDCLFFARFNNAYIDIRKHIRYRIRISLKDCPFETETLIIQNKLEFAFCLASKTSIASVSVVPARSITERFFVKNKDLLSETLPA